MAWRQLLTKHKRNKKALIYFFYLVAKVIVFFVTSKHLAKKQSHVQNWLQDDRFCNFMFIFANNLKNKPKYYRYMRVLLINGSPKGPNGSLCALLDRVFYSLGQSLEYKPAASVVSSDDTSAYEKKNVNLWSS
jgi:hypothetical protein